MNYQERYNECKLSYETDAKKYNDITFDIYGWNETTSTSATISEYFLKKCKEDDRPEYRKWITDSRSALHYCIDIEARPEVKKHITRVWDAYEYLCNVNYDFNMGYDDYDEVEVKKHITEEEYCEYFHEDPPRENAWWRNEVLNENNYQFDDDELLEELKKLSDWFRDDEEIEDQIKELREELGEED